MIGWIRHIEYLLLHNDCVAVPGLGCFSVVHHEARLLPDGRSYLPPTRSILFEAGAVGNDELLVGSIMRALFLSRDEALDEIAEGVAVIRSELKSSQRYELGRLGYLIDMEGRVTFQSSNENPLEYPRFGLAPLTGTLPSEEIVENEIVSTDVVEEQQPIQKNPDRIYISFPRRLVRVASVAAAIIVFLLMVSRPIDTPDTTAHYAGVLSAELFAPSDKSIENSSVDLWEPLAAADVATSAMSQSQQPAQPVQPALTTVKGEAYYIIVASLPSRASAETQITCFRQQGITHNLMIDETASKTRLYVASFAAKAEAKQYLSQLVKEQPLFANAWIMKAER